MRVLAIGDVVGAPGCEFVRRRLPEIKRQLSADLTIVNGENSAVGNGILPSSAAHLLDSGAEESFLSLHDRKKIVKRVCNVVE